MVQGEVKTCYNLPVLGNTSQLGKAECQVDTPFLNRSVEVKVLPLNRSPVCWHKDRCNDKRIIVPKIID